MLLHGMQHHVEIAEQLSQANESPGDIDFIFYAWQPVGKKAGSPFLPPFLGQSGAPFPSFCQIIVMINKLSHLEHFRDIYERSEIIEIQEPAR